MNILESKIRDLTQPVNGQFPRPWMTDMAQPERARIFVVGYNQATAFPAALVGNHDDYIDVLFNRNGQSCRALYKRLCGDEGPSPTSTNIDKLSINLAKKGLTDVIKTNVICYSTPMSSDMTHKKNPGGKIIGRKIFEEILCAIRPVILIAHGSSTTKELGRVLSAKLPSPVQNETDGVLCVRIHTQLREMSYTPMVFIIPSLAPPRWNFWQKWAEPYLAETCEQVRKILDDHRQEAVV